MTSGQAVKPLGIGQSAACRITGVCRRLELAGTAGLHREISDSRLDHDSGGETG